MEVKLDIRLDESSSIPLYEQLSAAMRRAVVDGKLIAGSQLPSLRDLSQQLNISVATVRRAFRQLLEEGWLTLKQGSGTYVADIGLQPQLTQNIPTPPENIADSGFKSVPFPGALHPHIASSLERRGKSFEIAYDFCSELPAEDAFSGQRWDDIVSRWTSDSLKNPERLTDPAGLPELREQIHNWLKLSRGMECSVDQIFITSGAQQARNLISRLLVDQGTAIAFEDPGKITARWTFESRGAQIVPISVDDSGLVVQELLRHKNIAALYTMPSAQFPTGAVLSKARRREVADWAQKVNALIIEDDNSSEFNYESRLTSAIHAFDQAKRTIYIGTFSQSAPPSWRIGFMVVPDTLRDPVFRLKSIADRCTSPIAQRLVLHLFTGGFFSQQWKRLQREYETRRNAMLQSLQEMPADTITYTPVKGGTHQAIWLRSDISDEEVALQCSEKRVAILPLSQFYIQKPVRNGLMLSFTNLEVGKLLEGMSILREVLNQYVA